MQQPSDDSDERLELLDELEENPWLLELLECSSDDELEELESE